MRSLFFALFLSLLAAPAFAAAPSELSPYIKAGSPYGQATLNKLIFHVYDANLWTDAKTWSMQKPFALELQYGMGISGEQLVKRSLDEMNGQEKLTPAQQTAYAVQLGKLFPDVKKGDRITAIYLPAKETRLYYNGKYRGHIADAVFSKKFIGIWMSPATSEPEVRQLLLVKKN